MQEIGQGRRTNGIDQRAVGARKPAFATGIGWADQEGLADFRRDHVERMRCTTGCRIDIGNDILIGRFACPEEFPGGGVYRIENDFLPRNAGDDLPLLARIHIRVDPADFARVGAVSVSTIMRSKG